MTNRIFAASYERGIELMAAGCPLDYPEALARHSAARRNSCKHSEGSECPPENVLGRNFHGRLLVPTASRSCSRAVR